ncbi:MAG: hypothetical protein WCF65_01085 [Parachlamydiaceae bacterium]
MITCKRRIFVEKIQSQDGQDGEDKQDTFGWRLVFTSKNKTTGEVGQSSACRRLSYFSCGFTFRGKDNLPAEGILLILSILPILLLYFFDEDTPRAEVIRPTIQYR